MANDVIQCSSACTVTVQVEITTPFFQIDESGGALIAGSILAVWALAWSFRALVRVLNISDGLTNESEK